MIRRLLPLFALLQILLMAAPAAAQDRPEPVQGVPNGAISVQDNAATDLAIRQRITRILDEVDAFDSVRVRVDAGIVTLTGEVPDQSSGERLKSLIARVDGVVAIEDNTSLTTDFAARLQGVRDRFMTRLNQVIAGLPFVGLGLLVGAVIVLVGGWLSRRRATLSRIAPNPFIAEFLGQSLRLVSWIVALVVALGLMEANALLGTLLGAAGIFGISLSFAARDTIEGFLATILLSLRQPFNPNDLVEVNGLRGRVIRLTSRGTTLLTLDGNHIRIPNQIIYKAVLTNYTRNSERRFSVDLIVDPGCDLWRARALVLKTMGGMDFVLDRPEPVAWVEPQGIDQIVIRAAGWVSQEGTDFDQARGEAFRLLHGTLAAAGYGVPEPVHRIHLDTPAEAEAGTPDKPRVARPRPTDLRPDAGFEQMVDREREAGGRNLLNQPTHRPEGAR